MEAWIVWLIVMVIFLIIEGVTLNLVTIWFAAGALGATIAALLDVSYWLQGLIFLIVSIIGFLIFLILVRPRMGERKKNPVPTNADRIIGQEGIVIQRIDPLHNTGQIRVCGQIWSAISTDERIIEENEKVKVKDIRGVKAVV